ncbi:MAG: glycoside hydrolase family 3 C-terminal domain-containing protein [Ginsengibacter sp.]
MKTRISRRVFLLPLIFIWNQTSAQRDTVHGSRLFQQRAAELLKQFTTEEKIAFLQYTQPSIKRLHIPAYNWWNEALHGVARNGVATVFPQAIAMAATWDTALINQMGDVVSTEARAKYNDALQKNDSNGIYQGLTFWSPNINIFRDPRWGRGQETYGEDPFLTAQIGTAYVKGLQGNDPKYLKVAATAKHFAVHSGPESERHSFDARVSRKDLYETYLPAFEALVTKAKVEGVMCAYNRFDGAPCCANAELLQKILKDKWHFSGHIVTDCWAISDMVNSHKTYSSTAEAAAASLIAGSDLSCGPEMGALKIALQKNPALLTNIDSALYHLLLTRFKLGMFENPNEVPFSFLGIEDVDTRASREMAKRVAIESMVLLKNKHNLLPLDKSVHTIAVIGPYANNADVLLGNYNGTPSSAVTFLQGIHAKVGPLVKALYAEGVPVPGSNYAHAVQKGDSINRALKIAKSADLIIMVAGISSRLEGEEGDANVTLNGFYKGDRTSLEMPIEQEALLKKLAATHKKIILLLTSGSVLSVNWEKRHIPAIIQAWYPGEEAGNAAADIIFGDYNPSGRLPVTFYKSTKDLPAFQDYNMKGRTYRYFKKKPLFPFGYGLGFSRFSYEGIRTGNKIIHATDTIRLTVQIKNAGVYDGSEVVQLYLKKINDRAHNYPVKSLQGFTRVTIPKRTGRMVSFMILPEQLRYFDEAANDYKIASGHYELQVGSSSSDIRQRIRIKVKS